MLIPLASVSADIAVPRFQTAQAYGENLTCIGIQVINFDLVQIRFVGGGWGGSKVFFNKLVE